MSVYSIYFSPTGGTKRVIEIIGQELSYDKQIDLSIHDYDYVNYNLKSDDLCLIAIPSFAGRAPLTALERIKKITPNGAMAVAIIVYGNRAYDDTLLELKTELSNCGFQVIAGICAISEHSILRQFAKNRPDEKDRSDMHKFSKKIKSIVSNRDNITDFHVPGNTPFKKYNASSIIPKTNKNCNRCGMCITNCPVQAICKQSYSIDSKSCISCMRCVSLCKSKAKHLDKTTKFIAYNMLKKQCSSRKLNEIYHPKHL